MKPQAPNATGIENATLVGHSTGAYIVEAFCAKHPHRMERLVFVDSGTSAGDKRPATELGGKPMAP